MSVATKSFAERGKESASRTVTAITNRRASSTQSTVGNLAIQRQVGSIRVQRKCACGGNAGASGMCPECMEKQAAGMLQRKAKGEAESGAAPSIVHDVLRSSGKPLDAETRSGLEPKFGADFSGVRVHTDGQAAESAAAVNALAYTVGNHVVFGEGQYSPGSSAGRRILSHELAHVVQQSGGAFSGVQTLSIDTDPASALEQEAHAASDMVQRDEDAGISSRSVRPMLQRFLSTEPAGGCGICYGLPREAGKAAHALIQQEFEVMYPLGLIELPVSSPTDENGRLDLAVATPTGFEIGEIKPANAEGYGDGILQIAFYVSALAAMFPTSTINPLTRPLPPLIFPTLSPKCPTQTLIVNPPVGGVYGYYCQPGFAEMRRNCPCKDEKEKQPQELPQPVAVPRTVVERIKEFVRGVIETGEDATAAAQRFLQQNPELKNVILAASITAIVGLVISMLAEDIATLGAAILNNPIIIAAITALFRVAQMAAD